MDDYIKREAAISSLRLVEVKESADNFAPEMLSRFRKLPSADVAEVRHGRWVATDKYMVDKCSNCQFEMDWDDVPLWPVDMPHFKDSCPNCWAKMDGGADNV